MLCPALQGGSDNDYISVLAITLKQLATSTSRKCNSGRHKVGRSVLINFLYVKLYNIKKHHKKQVPEMIDDVVRMPPYLSFQVRTSKKYARSAMCSIKSCMDKVGYLD
ncbi:hypothetical protein OSB04_016318 [Centaurea solstitialis]|uniref:Uncharacterized protein n=1 Tax=Centaurea solstitialis TaxID=347529 RepID=A0AA38T8F2_9ASTR|nr:hypothetical protein OSB04_016318 [Centaurea solstitialis]